MLYLEKESSSPESILFRHQQNMKLQKKKKEKAAHLAALKRWSKWWPFCFISLFSKLHVTEDIQYQSQKETL